MNLLKITEAAKYIGVGVSTLRKLALEQHKIAFLKIGGQYRFRAEDLERYLNDVFTPASSIH